MKRKNVLLIASLLVICVSLAFGVYLYMRSQGVTKPSWMKLGSYVMYEQFFVWSGHNETKYMTWNITKLDDIADLHLASHGVNVSQRDMLITSGESNWTINVDTRDIIDSSDPTDVGKKSPFWIDTDVTIGSTVDILYGTSVISKSEPIYVLERQRDCWVVEYNWTTANMKRWYDKFSGILLKTHVILFRQGITITITETVVHANVDLKS